MIFILELKLNSNKLKVNNANILEILKLKINQDDLQRNNKINAILV